MKYKPGRNAKRDNKLRQYHQKHPELSHTEVAQHFRLKLTRARMSQILKEALKADA